MDPVRSVLLGYLFDGVTVRGYSMCVTRQCRSCYKLKAGQPGSHTSHYEYARTADCDLDEANGVVINGTYTYVVTPNYPFVMPGYYGSTFAQMMDDASIATLGINTCAGSTPSSYDPYANFAWPTYGSAPHSMGVNMTLIPKAATTFRLDSGILDVGMGSSLKLTNGLEGKGLINTRRGSSLELGK